MSDETEAGQVPEELTEVVATDVGDVGPTAWAEVPDEEISRGRLLSRVDWRIIVGIIVAVAIAAVSVAATIVLTKPHHTPAVIATPPSPPAPPPPPPSLDDRYIDLVNTGFPPGHPVPDRERAIRGGHWVCEYVGEGNSINDAIKVSDDKSRIDNGPNHHEIEVGVNAAITVYCPEYRSQQTRDDGFVATLKAQGTRMKDGSNNFQPMITAGRDACKLMDTGESRTEVVNEVYSVHTEGETRKTAEDFVTAAIKYFCPQYQ